MGHKNKPIEILISSGLEVHLALRSCIATLCLTVAKIVRSFVTAKDLMKKLLQDDKIVFVWLFVWNIVFIKGLE
mgnify:CR=1 FL=1